MQLFVKNSLITERMFVVISYFILLLKGSFINIIRAIILNDTFQSHFTWIINHKDQFFIAELKCVPSESLKISILQGIILNYQNCCLTGLFFFKETYSFEDFIRH